MVNRRKLNHFNGRTSIDVQTIMNKRSRQQSHQQIIGADEALCIQRMLAEVIRIRNRHKYSIVFCEDKQVFFYMEHWKEIREEEVYDWISGRSQIVGLTTYPANEVSECYLTERVIESISWDMQRKEKYHKSNPYKYRQENHPYAFTLGIRACIEKRIYRWIYKLWLINQIRIDVYSPQVYFRKKAKTDKSIAERKAPSRSRALVRLRQQYIKIVDKDCKKTARSFMKRKGPLVNLATIIIKPNYQYMDAYDLYQDIEVFWLLKEIIRNIGPQIRLVWNFDK